MNLYIFTLRGHKMQILYTSYTKLGLSTPKMTLGDLFPTCPQHKYGELRLSHFAGA